MPNFRSQGQIIEKGKNRYLVRIFLGRGQDGRRQYFSKVVEGKKSQAKAFLTAKQREKDLGVFVQNSRQILNDHLDEWLARVRTKVAPQTYASYETLTRVHVRPHIGPTPLANIKLKHVQDVFDRMVETSRSPRTVRATHQALNMAFKDAIRAEKLMRNPCAFVSLPRMVKSETKAFTPDEVRELLVAAESDPCGIIFEFAVVSGMRPEEYLALTWEDVDLDEGVARVRRVLVWNRSQGGYRFDQPKTHNSRRVVRLPSSFIPTLKRHRRLQLEQKMQLGGEYENFNLVFASQLGTPLNQGNLSQRNFKRVLEAAGLNDRGFTLYSLRHTCATLMLLEGVNPKVISEKLGHTSVKLTLDTYAHVLPDMQDAASEQLGRLLYG
jgi:integrase